MTAPVNYTTSIGANRTVAEIQAMLAKRGADAVAVLYTDSAVSGVTFVARGSQYRLPVDVDAMHRLLLAEGRAGNLGSLSRAKWSSREQAARVAWRVIKDWLAAQLSLVDAQMVPLDELMLPYLVIGTDTLLRDQWRDRKSVTMGETT